MSANENIRDSVIRHSIFLEKYGDGLAERVVALLNDVDNDIVKKIASGLITDYSETRLKTLLAELRAINVEVYSNVFDVLKTDLTKQGQATAEYEAKAISEALPAYQATLPTPQKLAVLATTSPIDGFLLKSWTDKMSESRLGKIEQQLRRSITQGETIDQIVSKIRGTREGGFRDGILNKPRHNLRSLVITANSAIASKAREETHRANSDVIKAVMWLSTLDTRTSSACQSLDGKTWALDEPHPTTPHHIRCRSILTPITKSYDELGIAKKEISKTTRASMDGQVPSSTTYGDWLKKQPEGRQNDILGKERADIFRTGKLPFDDLYRKDGSFRTVDELRKKLDLPDAPDVPNVPDAPEPKAEPKPKAFSPINPKITDDTVQVVPRLKAQKQMDSLLTIGANDGRYLADSEFKATKGKGWGKAAFPATMTDEAASMLVALQPELDAISDRFGIPRLRGYRAVSGNRTMGNLGDGSLGVNPTYFNAFASKVGGKSADDFIANVAAKRDAIKGEIDQLRVELDEVKARLKAIKNDQPEWLVIYDEYADKAKAYNAKIKQFNDSAKKAAATSRKGSDSVSEWKVGDDISKRPYNNADYFSGIDRARNVLFHEMAHHVHQMYKKEQKRERGYLPPLERELRAFWLNNFNNIKPETRARRDRQTSTYSLANEKEWFAENFSLVMMGKSELADPDAVAIIERILND